MKLPAFKTGIALVTATLCAPLHAGWSDVSDDEDCRIASSWELGTTILITKPKAEAGSVIMGGVMTDDVLIYITNDNWKSLQRNPENSVADFSLRMEDAHGNWIEGDPYVGDHSLLLVIKLEWLDDFQYSSTVSFTRDGDHIGSYRWNMSHMLFRFKRCVREARAPIAERERRARIREATPVDPFAK